MEHVEALIKALGAVQACRNIEDNSNLLEAMDRLHRVLERAQEQAIEDAAKDAA